MSIEDLDPEALYHLADPLGWADYGSRGLIDPPSLALEGFVHCSWGRQVAGTLSRHFSEVEGLLALELDPQALGSPLVEEDTAGSGQPFPHVYGPIPVTAVRSATTVP